MFRFKITPDGGETFEVDSGTRDIAKWERITKGANFSDLGEKLRMSDLYKIAWIAAVRQGLYEGKLADFEESVDLEFEDLAEPDPTQPAR